MPVSRASHFSPSPLSMLLSQMPTDVTDTSTRASNPRRSGAGRQVFQQQVHQVRADLPGQRAQQLLRLRHTPEGIQQETLGSVVFVPLLGGTT